MKVSKFYLSLIIFCLAIALLISNDTFYYTVIKGYTGDEQKAITKLEEVLDLTKTYYVDTLNLNKATENAIKGLLESLDPHSVYFNPEQGQYNDETFEGRYQGIGIQYDVIDKIIYVISVMPGSPSEKAGLQAGDKIVEINGETSIGMDNADVPRKLKGPKGSKVNVGILRDNLDEILNFEIIRDEIPIYTISSSFMVDDSTGYIRITRFASTTADELESALIKLEKKGLHRLLLDLRGNSGGYLSQAVEVTGKFLKGHKKVVYTKGRFEDAAEEYYSDDYGESIDREYPLIILIDAGSASASEIVAGALQDYDRALIAGEHSFGKGLVQNEFILSDDSRLRLTVAKYYTPSGRLIQRRYKDKSIADYYVAAYSDSVAYNDVDSTISYFTSSGRKVFGGGGIQPDVAIPFETTTQIPKVVNKLISKRVFFETAVEIEKRLIQKYSFEEYLKRFEIKASDLKVLKEKAEYNNIELTDENLEKDRAFLSNRLKAEIARTLWSENEYWQVTLHYDNQFEKALNLFRQSRELYVNSHNNQKN